MSQLERMFIDMSLMRSEHTRSLEGWHFVVLRPSRQLAAVHQQLRDAVQGRIPGMPVSYPGPHITMGAFPVACDRAEIQRLVASWSANFPPLHVQTAQLTTFPAPYKSVILELSRSPALVSALKALRANANEMGLPIAAQIPVDDWVFHLSVAYCSELATDDWDSLATDLQHVAVPHVASTVEHVDLIAFDRGVLLSIGEWSL